MYTYLQYFRQNNIFICVTMETTENIHRYDIEQQLNNSVVLCHIY